MTGSIKASLGGHDSDVAETLDELEGNRVSSRIREGDYKVWGSEPAEISDRLGWLESPRVMADHSREITELVEAVRAEGYTHALLLGMGGSSLAPEVFRNVFGVAEGYLELSVLDSTEPGTVLQYAESLDLPRTLFIVSTKSGGTVETFSFFKYFYNLVAEKVGEAEASAHFIAITDPGSGLEDTARQYGFRKTFLNDPNIGGRYSALSHFGLVPAALIGVDLSRLLDGAAEMSEECGNESLQNNECVWLGAALGALADSGRDKLTLLADRTFEPLGVWVEQLIAESTGKDGKGILPVEGEPIGAPDSYGDDRVFVYTGVEPPAVLDELERAGHPVIRLGAGEAYGLGAEMFRWMLATSVIGRVLGINPFDQPNVESAKARAREMVEEYREKGGLPELEPDLEDGDVEVYGAGVGVGASSAEGALREFLSQAGPGDYVAFQAYVQPTEASGEALQELRTKTRDRLRVATTAGYGPRFLHSTGQLHKGDGGSGLFVQITAEPEEDARIPDEAGSGKSSLTFGALVAAQSLGDRQALLDAGRRVIRFHLGDVAGDLRKLADALDGREGG